jgi:cold shock protein
MPTGRVRWFSVPRGFGLITPKTGSKDVYVQMSDVKKAGFDSLYVGELISFDIERSRGDDDPQAINIMSLDRPANKS